MKKSIAQTNLLPLATALPAAAVIKRQPGKRLTNTMSRLTLPAAWLRERAKSHLNLPLVKTFAALAEQESFITNR